jgi:hypothetical protein
MTLCDDLSVERTQPKARSVSAVVTRFPK